MRRSQLVALGVVVTACGIITWLLTSGPVQVSEAGPTRSNANQTQSKVEIPFLPEPPARPTPLYSQRSLPPLGSPLITTYPILKQRADAGDPRAACRLADELYKCSMLKQLKSSHSNLESSLSQLDPDSLEFDAKTRLAEFSRSQIQIDNRVCIGFVEKNVDEGWKHALQAAQFGTSEMRVHYAVYWGAALQHTDPSSAGWVAYRQNAPVFLQRAINEGSPVAFLFAGNFHLNGSSTWRVVPFDTVAGLSYYMALLAVATPEYRVALERIIERTVSDGRATEADLANARTAAAVLTQKLAGVSPNSVDFSKGWSANANGDHCEMTR